jgi:Sulfotransferase family
VTIATSALRLADRISRVTGLGRRPFDAEALLKEALAGEEPAAFGPDFGPGQFMEGLTILLNALEAEANLSLVGRLAVRWDTIRCMGNLLRMQREENRAPSIAETPIRRPLIITGLPRSGTTFLHRLLDCDPTIRSPSCWQTMAPYPPERGRDRRVERTERELRTFARMAPGFRDVHPLTARMPQECTEITAQVFQSLRFDTTFRIPSYLTWQDAHGHTLAYRFHKRFLQHLQHQTQDDPERVQWVLKCPDHVFALDAVRNVYPDARIVFVHRDPLKVLPSVAKLTEILRQPFTLRQNLSEIGAQVTGRWHQGVEAMMRAADNSETGSTGGEAICHIHYRDLTENPLGTITQLYNHFGMPLGEDAVRGITAEMNRSKRGGYGRNIYRFADHGLDARRERGFFASYMNRFGISEEIPVA